MIRNIPVVVADSNEILSHIFAVVTMMSQSSVDRFIFKIPIRYTSVQYEFYPTNIACLRDTYNHQYK